MNWKDVPNLFANGKFRIRIRWNNGDTEIVPLYVNSEGRAIAELNKNGGLENRTYPYQFVGLIARKIDDLSDEEQKEYDELCEWDYVEYHSQTFRIKTDESFLYLLSIRVYPFEWDETVIDSKTL